jgi:predicted dehydrogenase
VRRRAGILGYGYMGAIRHAALEERADCDVARIFSGEDDGWTEVVDDVALDCVFVCLPSHLTCEAVCRALAAGKDVFAEKPPGLSVDEVRRMMVAQAQSQRTLKFGFNHRYHPAVLAAERALAVGDLGELRWLRGRYGKPREPSFADTWRADPARAGGGILMDQGIHMLDLMCAFGGDFGEVKAFMGATSPGEVEDDVVAVLRTDRGVVATMHSSHTQSPPLFSLELGLEAGSIVLSGLLSRTGRYGPETLTVVRRGEPAAQVEAFTDDKSWRLELDEFFDCAARGAPIRVGSTAEALRVMTLVEAIYASAGRPLGLH